MKKKSVAGIVACGLAALCPPGVHAQSEQDWKFGAAIYGYFPSVGGTTTFPPGVGDGITVDAGTILNNLKFAFMGSIEANKGRWGGFADYMYLNVGNTKSVSRNVAIGGNPLPAGVTADADFDLKGSVLTLAGTYRAVTHPVGTMDLLFGARMLDIKQALSWQLNGMGALPVNGRGGSSEASLRNWDGIVGIKGRVAAGDSRWFLPYYFDVGAGRSQSTWQAMLGIGYAFKWGDILIAWRDLEYNMKSGTPIESVSFNGPGIAAVFHW